ncbi:MAG: glycerophosphodiester phosphodiesterase family protein [Byssovorax sp.]
MQRSGDALSALRRAPGGRAKVIGHRGVVRAGVPENTLEALAIAASEGADGVEIDVRAAASGEAVICHAPALSRVTGGADDRAVAALSLRELTRVDLGGGARVPTLPDALALARDAGLFVNVELAFDAPDRAAVVRAAARALRAFRTGPPVIISCFHPLLLAGIAALCPSPPRALLLHRSGWERPAALWARLHGLHVHPEASVTTRDLVERSHARGRVVNAWTVNDPDEARRLDAIGVDGIITDDPGRMRALLG